MAPIYKLWMMKRFTGAWWQLSEQERHSLRVKVQDALKQVGGKQILQCHSAWSTEEWTHFGVEEFPNIEAVQKHTQLLHELNWPRYVESVSVLGTKPPVS
jgi:hypothetical protein